MFSGGVGDDSAGGVPEVSKNGSWQHGFGGPRFPKVIYVASSLGHETPQYGFLFL